MHTLTLYQSISRWFLWLTIAVSLAACGGGGGSDNGFSAPDDTTQEPDASYSIAVELRDIDTGEQIDNPSPLEPVHVQVTVKDNDDNPVVSGNVSVSTTLGSLTPESGQILTNETGVALIELDVEGQEIGSAGEIVVTYDTTSTDQAPLSPLTFTVVEPALQLGYMNNGQFVVGSLDIQAPILSSTGSTPINVIVQGPDGDRYPEPLEVVFSSNCSRSEPPAATLDSPVPTANGAATSTYTAEGCQGQDTVTAALAVYPGISASGQLEVSPAEVGSIEFISAEPAIISLQGSGGKETSTLVFRVFNKDGLPANGIDVNFELSTEVGGVSLTSNSGVTDAAGEVSVSVSSGTVAGPVLVVASIVDNGVVVASTVSNKLVISSGIPYQGNFSASATVLNPGGDNFNGLTTTITAFVTDFFKISVPDDTAVFFQTEYGGFEESGSCTTVNGTCSVTWRSQNPRKSLFYTFVDDDGNVASLRTIFNTDCSVPNVPRGVPCPELLGQPYGARSSILAYTLGEESFDDANENGLYDVGEKFDDLPEAYVDFNEDGAFGHSETVGSCHPNCPAPAGDDEKLISLIENGVYDHGNGIYNGSRCSDAAEIAGSCSKELVHARTQLEILVAGDEPYGELFTGADVPLESYDVNISLSGSRTVYLYLSDKYNGRLPLGTTVTTESDYCDVEPEVNSVGNTSDIGPSRFAITVIAPVNAVPGRSSPVKISANVPAPGGDTGGITKTWLLTCTTN
ncbi:Ig-like domain-containing protein [Microbulbifer sp. 2304DJ12-6]|uniref:Ig-like domain-containing protein n=1 Tax=Microbulbifer sp. 2304DJ12-6 TaxID=3233340 RepID=UPI0039B0C452